ncbi:MAG: hypothetical protein ABR608_12875 [Pseudonocardiaceae bacterium]
MLIKVPCDRADQRIGGTLRLLDADGHPVELESSPGEKDLVTSEFELEVGRPAGPLHDSMIDAAVVVNIGSMPLPPGRYQWRLNMSEHQGSSALDRRGCGIG